MLYKLTTAIMALVAAVSAADATNSTSAPSNLKFTPCDVQVSCNAVLSKASGTPVTGATCWGVE